MRLTMLTTLLLTLLPNALAMRTPKLSCPRDNHTAEIVEENGINFYHLILPDDGQTVVIDTCSSITNFNTVLKLYPDGTRRTLSDEIASSFDSFFPRCARGQSRIEVDLDESGDYIVTITGRSGSNPSFGEFEISLSCRDQPSRASGSGSSDSSDSGARARTGGSNTLYIVLGIVIPFICGCFCFASYLYRARKQNHASVVM